MSVIITQRGASGQEPGIVEFFTLGDFDNYRHRTFPRFLFHSTTVEALAFRGTTLFAADDNLLFELPDARDTDRYLRRQFPDTVGDIAAMVFDASNHLWVIEEGDGTDTDQRIRFNDTGLDDLTDFDRFTLNDDTRRYTGLAILGTDMFAVGYERTDLASSQFLYWGGNFEGTATANALPDSIGITSAGGLASTDSSLLLTDGTRRIYSFDTPKAADTTPDTTYGPLETALFTRADSIAFADLDPEVDTGVAPIESNGSIPFTGRLRLSGFHDLGAGSPVGQARRITNARVGVYRSSGGTILQAGEDRAARRQRLVTPTEDDPLSPNGYRIFTGEVRPELHDLGTDPTATLQIEQGRQLLEPEDPGRVPHDLHITYIAMDIESED